MQERHDALQRIGVALASAIATHRTARRGKTGASGAGTTARHARKSRRKRHFRAPMERRMLNGD